MRLPDVSRLARIGAGWGFALLSIVQVGLWLNLTIAGIRGLATPAVGAGAETTPPEFGSIVVVYFAVLMFAGFTLWFGLLWRRDQLTRWMHLVARWPAPIDGLHLGRVSRTLTAVVLYLAVITMAFRLQSAFSAATNTTSVNVPSRGVPGAGIYIAEDLAGSVTAGLWEELILFALPVGLILRNRWSRWPWVVCAGVAALVLRLGIHLYYGWGSAFVLPWMVGALAVLWFGGSIWPLVIGHAMYDSVVSVANRIHSTQSGVFTGLDIVVLAAVAVLLVWWVKQRNQRKQAEVSEGG